MQTSEPNLKYKNLKKYIPFNKTTFFETYVYFKLVPDLNF